MIFCINGQQEEYWTEHFRGLQVQDRSQPAVGFTINGQDPERLDTFHLRIYAEQLNDIISQKEAHRVRVEYLARIREACGFS